jgi:hypothetical protein
VVYSPNQGTTLPGVSIDARHGALRLVTQCLVSQRLEGADPMSHDATVANQKKILANQRQILANQKRIEANQAKLDKVLGNQKKLDQVLANQKAILAKLS